MTRSDGRRGAGSSEVKIPGPGMACGGTHISAGRQIRPIRQIRGTGPKASSHDAFLADGAASDAPLSNPLSTVEVNLR